MSPKATEAAIADIPKLSLVARPDKEARRERRRLEKHQEDQVRLIDGWEQYRALWDGIDFKRQIINMGDKKVRFALVIMGALNAALLLVLTRGPVLRSLPTSARVVLIALLPIYGVVTYWFVLHTIEALRPRPEARVTDNDHWVAREGAGAGVGASGVPAPMGLMIHGGDLTRTFDHERKLWGRARLSELNSELILFNRSSSMILHRQLRELGKVYHGLKLLAILAALILALLVGSTLTFPGVSP